MSDMAEIKALIEAQGKAWEEFKTANDARLKQIEEKGHAAEDAVAQVATVNADLNKLSKDIADQMLVLQRPPKAARARARAGPVTRSSTSKPSTASCARALTPA